MNDYIVKRMASREEVKKDNRIIECNGMMIPLQCKKCSFGVVKEDEVACYAPDYDLIPVIGLKKREVMNGQQIEEESE